MKKTIILTLMIVFACGIMSAEDYHGTAMPNRSEIVDGVRWRYILNNETLTVVVGATNRYDGYVVNEKRDPTGIASGDVPDNGRLAIPRELGGYPVACVGRRCFSQITNLTEVLLPDGITTILPAAFYHCTSLAKVSIPEGVTTIPNQCFMGCTSLKEIEFPSTLRSIYPNSYSSAAAKDCAFANCGSSFKSVFFNGPPIATYGYTNLINQCYNARIYYAREYAAQWQKVLALNRFAGFSSPNTNLVEIVSCGPRETDPSLLDVVYKVKSDKPTVKVRALAYLDGVRSFTNVVRMESLVDGTSSSVGDSVTANEEHTISWKASDDLAVDLAHVTVEVLAVENDLLPLEVIRIPANGNKQAMEISWNIHSKEQVFDALLWLYADRFAGLQLADGVLTWNGKPLLTGSDFYTTQMREDPYSPGYMYEEWTYHTDDAIDCVYHAMGFQILKGTELEYANKMTRLGLVAPDVYYGEKNYAFRWLNAGN